MNPFYCEGPVHNSTYPAPLLGQADHPEHVHCLCRYCGPAVREAQSNIPQVPLTQFILRSVPQARAALEVAAKNGPPGSPVSPVSPVSPQPPA